MPPTTREEPERPYVAIAERPQAPGVVVIHSWFGLTPHFRAVCEDLAKAGISAVAPDLYGGEVAENESQARELRRRLDDETALAGAEEALDVIVRACSAGTKLGAVGFSMGGELALELACRRPDAIAAVATFYGVRVPRGLAHLEAAVQGHFATDDPYATAEEIDELVEALDRLGKRHELYRYPAPHAFTNASRPESYDAASASTAWRRTYRFLGAELR